MEANGRPENGGAQAGRQDGFEKVQFEAGQDGFEKLHIDAVKGITLECDISNLAVTIGGDAIVLDYHAPRFNPWKPEIGIRYEERHAFITLKARPLVWMNLFPAISGRGEALLTIPKGWVQTLTLNTRNGNIEVGRLDGVEELKLVSSVGNISVDRFGGGQLDVKAGNGKIELLHSPGWSMEDATVKLKTNNGRIAADPNHPLKKAIVKSGPGQRADLYSSGKKKWTVSASVGSIFLKRHEVE